MLALAGCNADLRAERAALDRLDQQQTIYWKKNQSCGMGESIDAGKAWSKAYEKCKPYTERLQAALAKHEDHKEVMRLIREEEIAPACIEKEAAFKKLSEIEKRVSACMAAAPDPRPELKLRTAEYVAACQKCALKERCEANMEHNDKVLGVRRRLNDPAPKTPEALTRLQEQAKELGDKFLLGCDK